MRDPEFHIISIKVDCGLRPTGVLSLWGGA